MMEFVFRSTENIVGNGETADHQDLLYFPLYFTEALLLRVSGCFGEKLETVSNLEMMEKTSTCAYCSI